MTLIALPIPSQLANPAASGTVQGAFQRHLDWQIGQVFQSLIDFPASYFFRYKHEEEQKS
jgi:hypothetical protein